MAILGTLLKKGITLRESFEQLYTSPVELQKQELRKLLIHCQTTRFGQHFNFEGILRSLKSEDVNSFYKTFKSNIPIHDYNEMYEKWWCFAKDGKRNICWPGTIKYFALSSGTSGASSKYIPITKEMLKSIRKTSIRQILTLSKYDLPGTLFTKGILMLGGSTNLRRSGHYFEGDLSGITTAQIPFWFQHFYKPGKRISKTEWSEKLDEITLKAREWDIGIIVGVPAWLQLLLEKVVDHYKVNTIHDIWPNLEIFVHGGVSFEPYKKGFEKLLARDLIYVETYLASEGFLAFQSGPGKKAMRLVLNNGIFYEFIPFNSENFSEDGELRNNPVTYKIDEVKEGPEYAVLITTNAGAWRYIIGDVIKFTSVKDCEIVITGRTKLFLSLCGEHLSLDNINKAVQLVENELNLDIREFTVVGESTNGVFGHRWFIGTDDPVDAEVLKVKLDGYLKVLNDDYRVERNHALGNMELHAIPTTVIYDWMEIQGKVGASNKFPRVMKKEKARDWIEYLRTENHFVA